MVLVANIQDISKVCVWIEDVADIQAAFGVENLLILKNISAVCDICDLYDAWGIRNISNRKNVEDLSDIRDIRDISRSKTSKKGRFRSQCK